MNVIDGWSMLGTLALWVVGAIALASAATYFLRPRVRERYRGGARRYLFAVVLQSAAFMVPIPVVLVLLLGRPLPAGMDVALAILAGFGVLTLLNFLPVTGPMLRDLRQAQLDVALNRGGQP